MLPSTDMRTYTARSGRIAYFDNAKLLLMMCVVVGHLLKTGGALNYRYARAFFVFIYSFHMPAFIFLSGLFVNRRTWSRKKALVHASRMFLLGMLAKLLRSAFPWLLGDRFSFELLSEGGLPWFMFALAAYYVLAWLLLKVDAIVVGEVGLTLALLAGYVPAIGDFLCLSRILVFFPFFWLGHMMEPRRVRGICTSKGVRVASLVVLAAWLVCCATFTRSLYPYRHLFMGKECYAEAHIAHCSPLNRLLAYAVSLASGFSVLGLVPDRRMPLLTEAGRRTVQVYLLHLEAIDFLRFLRIPYAIVHTGRWGWTLLLILGVALTLLLAWPDLPTIVFGGQPAGEAAGKRRQRDVAQGESKAL